MTCEPQTVLAFVAVIVGAWCFGLICGLHVRTKTSTGARR